MGNSRFLVAAGLAFLVSTAGFAQLKETVTLTIEPESAQFRGLCTVATDKSSEPTTVQTGALSYQWDARGAKCVITNEGAETMRADLNYMRGPSSRPGCQAALANIPVDGSNSRMSVSFLSCPAKIEPNTTVDIWINFGS
jgi:hypothetical protein